MMKKVMKKLYLFVMLLPFFWGCRDTLMDLSHYGEAGEGAVPVQIVLGKEDNGLARTIAPSHIPYADWSDPAKYSLRMTGFSDMGGSIDQAFSVSNNRGILLLDPGAWELTLTATNVNSNKIELTGETYIIVHRLPTSSYIDLEPVTTEAGTVCVQFTLPQALVSGLAPTGNAKTITVVLTDEAGNEVANTRQTLTANAADANSVITYTANDNPVKAGKYTLKLTAPFTGANNVQKTFGWGDILYVEGNRESAHSVTLPGSALGKPSGKPTNKAKAGLANFSVPSSNGTTGQSANNITGTQRFDTYGDGLWIYAANWDGSGGNRGDSGTGLANGNGTWGNEVLLVTWDSVFDADYYELELLLHPDFAPISNSLIVNSAKYDQLPVTDAMWTDYESRQVNGMRTFKMTFSGDSTSANYYKTKTYPLSIYKGTSSGRETFTFVAWRDLANGLNGSYSVYDTFNGSPHLVAPDPAGITMRGNVPYRIGLEGNCNALAILVTAFSPMHWYGIRVRAVNEYGYSDWVYWKGGKN